MDNGRKKLNISRQSGMFLLLFAAALAFMLWKCPYGFGGSDEAFYLTVPHRLCLGDSLFEDEWHLSQLFSFFTYPFVRIYRLIAGSNDGIMLSARYLYAALHSAAALIIYFRLKKYGAAAIPAALIFMLFTPFDMMCLSYNTVAVDMLSVGGAFAASAKENARAAHIAAGVCLACAVICCPYLAAVYVIYFLAVTAYAALYKKTGKNKWRFSFLSWRVFGLVTVGIMIMTAMFAAFFFTHSGVKELVSALPGLFSDPEHPSYSLGFMIRHYVYCLLTGHRLLPLPLAFYAVSLCFLGADKRREKRRGLHLGLASLCALLCFALFVKDLTQSYYNAVMLPFPLVGFTAYLLLEEKPRALFAALFVPGIIYSVCVCASSNMGFSVLSMALVGSNVASVIFVGLLLREMCAPSRECGIFGFAASLCALALFAALIITAKATHCFWDESPARLNSRIEDGPARGIVTSERLSADYERVYNDLCAYSDKERGNILVCAQETWCYLILDDYPYSTFSAWLSGIDEVTAERLELYYGINPQKSPRYIYILKDNAFAQPDIDTGEVYAAAKKYGYAVEENDVSYKLEKFIKIL